MVFGGVRVVAGAVAGAPLGSRMSQGRAGPHAFARIERSPPSDTDMADAPAFSQVAEKRLASKCRISGIAAVDGAASGSTQMKSIEFCHQRFIVVLRNRQFIGSPSTLRPAPHCVKIRCTHWGRKHEFAKHLLITHQGHRHNACRY